MSRWSHLQEKMNSALIPGCTHFWLSEAACRGSEQVDFDCACHNAVGPIVPALWALLEDYRVLVNMEAKRQLGDDCPIQGVHITSAYRCPIYNEHLVDALGAHPDSAHRYGLAVDLLIPEWLRGDTREHLAINMLLRVGFKRIGYSQARGFLHADLLVGEGLQTRWDYKN